MDKKLYSIIELAQSKYGFEHEITMQVSKVISPMIKSAQDYSGLTVEVNVDELESLFNPDKYEFEVPSVEKIKVEL